MGPQASLYVRQLCRLNGALDDADVARLSAIMVERVVHAREPVFAAGDHSDSVYILVRGRVKLATASDNGKEIILDLLKAGDIFGETALVESGVRQLTAEALEESIVLGLRCGDFEALLAEWPALGNAVTKILARRLLQQQRQLQQLVSKSVSSRLATLILEEERRAGGGEVALDLTHLEIAQLIGTSRETVTALLSRFQALRIIAHDRRRLRVLDGERLVDCAQGRLQVSPRQPLLHASRQQERIAVSA
jgi:CRP/FNR family transcriptional regulator